MNDEKTNDGVGAYKWVALALLTVGYFMQQGTADLQFRAAADEGRVHVGRGR